MAEIKGTQADIQKVRLLEKEREMKRQELLQRRQNLQDASTGKLDSIGT